MTSSMAQVVNMGANDIVYGINPEEETNQGYNWFHYYVIIIDKTDCDELESKKMWISHSELRLANELI